MGDATPLYILVQLILCVSIFWVKREHVIVSLIAAMCFLPSGISIKIATLDLQAVRLLAICGIIRVLADGNRKRSDFNTIDKLFFSYQIIGFFIYVFASDDFSHAFIYKCGKAVDSIFLYIVLRYSIQSKEDILLAVKSFAVCVFVLIPFVMVEYFFEYNMFTLLGRDTIDIRGGEVRATATFSHAILFGSFAVALMPMFYALRKYGQTTLSNGSLICCFFIVIACSSSGPIIALAATVFFMAFFKWREKGKLLFWSIVTSSLFIHFVRESPIWHLLYVRISVKASSTGYHRYLLIEAAIKEFWNWWLVGYGESGPSWHEKYWPWTYAHFTDVTNHYLLVGVRGGVFTMFLFIVLCYKVIKNLGIASIYAEKQSEQWLWWATAVMMISHCITFLSVAYFGQIEMLLYLTIAIGALATSQNYKNSSSTLKKL